MAAARLPASWWSSASMSPTLSQPTGSSTPTPGATSNEKDECSSLLCERMGGRVLAAQTPRQATP